MAKKETLSNKNVGELTSMLVKQREELRELRFAAAGARPKDSAAPKKTRRAIARIMTVLHEKKSEETPTASTAQQEK